MNRSRGSYIGIVAGIVYVVVVAASGTPIFAQTQPAGAAETGWTPEILADGQPNITGTWNNSNAMFTPLELPEDLVGQDLSAAELLARAEARASGRKEGSEWRGHENSRGVGGYGTYWFDWYWETPVDIGQASIIVDPPTGRVPERTANARESIAMNMAELHAAAENMESGDRCISRGVLGMMMPTEYNNGTLILQSPGYVVIHSEMIHNARIIPIDRPHADARVRQWEGDPRGRWEGNTLIVESTNFRAVKNIRGPSAGIRSRQSEAQRVVERFTLTGPDELRYSVTMDDAETKPRPGRPRSRSTATMSTCSSSTPATRGTTRCRTPSAAPAWKRRVARSPGPDCGRADSRILRPAAGSGLTASGGGVGSAPPAAPLGWRTAVVGAAPAARGSALLAVVSASRP